MVRSSLKSSAQLAGFSQSLPEESARGKNLSGNTGAATEMPGNPADGVLILAGRNPAITIAS
jgi:hypothetical protein